ncbi:hypothetical protein [Tropicimonas sp. S265A]|uniref:hypothetical protein n=1 Tax=Tropicimonas sp. S265A TaxID=3415134 RepID=UPI003C7C7A6E
MPRFTTLFTALVLPCSALASGAGDVEHGGTNYLANAVFTYELFEATVDHVDLVNCPVEFDPDAVFCRMTLASEMANVFVFSFDDAQPPLAVKSYDLEGDFMPF